MYEASGIGKETARKIAAHVMTSPEKELDKMVSEELKIRIDHSTPIREGKITGIATAIGAFIPVVPFIVLTGLAAVWTAFGISMLSHFAVGAARSLFTGRGIFQSGLDMLTVGLGVAAVGYFVGDLLVSSLF